MNSNYKKYLTTIGIWAGCFILFCFVYMLVLAPQKKHKKQVEKRLAEKKQMYDSVFKMAQEETQIRLSEEMEYLQTEDRKRGRRYC